MLTNITTLESTFKKKSSSLAYHLMREGVETDDWRTARTRTNENEADLLTKFLPFGEKRCKFARKALTHIHGSSWMIQC